MSLLTRLTLSQTTAEDLLQDLFVRLSNSRSFDRARDPTAYVIRAAANLAFQWRRTQRRTSILQGLPDEPIDRSMSAEAILEHQEQCSRVLQALDRMSELSRHVILLHGLQGESYDTIASELEKTPHQVRAICAKAIHQLRDLLGTPSSKEDPS